MRTVPGNVLFGCALVLMGFALGAARPPGIAGRWLTDDRQGVVRISLCGEQLCGRIDRVLAAGPAVPASDVNNPDPALRRRPLVGLLTLWGFVADGDGWRGGRAYDPKSGQSYRSSLKLEPDGSLKLTGCVLFICESRRWTRVP